MSSTTARGVQLQYRFITQPQTGSQVDNPLFDLLSAVATEGSIQGAARALGLSYRHLWGSLKQWEETVGQALVVWQRGQPARLTAFAERLLWAERQARERLVPHIEALRRELQRVMEEALDGSRQVLRIDASHDLMLPVLQTLADAQGLHIELRFAGSLDALRSLAEGRCVVAGFHVPPLSRSEHYARALKALLKPGRHKLISAMRRTQGLMVAPGNPQGVHSLADVGRMGLRFAAREPGSGTGLLAEHLAAQQGFPLASLLTAVQETSHLACAAAVASGSANAALGIEAAAARYGLGFVPLVEEDYYLVCLADALEQPAVRLLCRLLQGPDWRGAVGDLEGYSCPPRTGEVLSLTRALPWWTFRAPKATEPAPD
ncbi:MAG: substrate-binding domain-containing protein [Betaproteobacteria bacterium]|jgi:putative molybdopterin biosynthesis protein